MTYEKISISIPTQILAQVDHRAGQWCTNRSAAITRIFQEWLAAQAQTASTPYHLNALPDGNPIPEQEAQAA